MSEQKTQINYSAEKNSFLKENRGISFEEAEAAIVDGKILTVIKHPNQKKYPNQKIYVLHINHYVYMVPFVQQSNTEIFLKTIIPSRKALKPYLKNSQV